MAFCTMQFWGAALKKQCSMNVILPESEKFKPPYCLLIQLHGMSDDHTIWLRRTNIERYVSELPLVVVMPDGARGIYCDTVLGAYERHIMEDVLGFAEKYFPVRRDRMGRAIGGLSMGGYGSMKLALKYPQKFASIVSHSGGFRVPDPTKVGTPDQPVIHRDDVYDIAAKLDVRKAPAIRLDCGKDDFLIDANRGFHRHLVKLGIKHEYREYPGAHEWSYWDEHVQQALKFHMKHLKV